MVYATTGTSTVPAFPRSATRSSGRLLYPSRRRQRPMNSASRSSFGRGLRSMRRFSSSTTRTSLQRLNVQYLNPVSGGTARPVLAFYSNVDSQVRGFELEIAASQSIISRSRRKPELFEDQVEGRRFRATTVPAPALRSLPTRSICARRQRVRCSISEAPFQATFNGGYEVAAHRFDRRIFPLQRSTTRARIRTSATSPTGTTFKCTPSYAIVDLFAGVTGDEGMWDVGVYAKNVFDKQVELARVAVLNNIYSNLHRCCGRL